MFGEKKCAPNASCAGNAAHFLTQTLNKRNANCYWAGFVRCLFLSFKRTALRVSLNLTAHNFVDELSWVTVVHHDLMNATWLCISFCLATAHSNGMIRKACNDTRLYGYGMMRAKRNAVSLGTWCRH